MENNISLSKTEKKLLQMIVDEMPNKKIAKELNYSQRMIEYYISR